MTGETVLLRYAAFAAIGLLALSTLCTPGYARKRCPRGYEACLTHQMSLGVRANKAAGTCSRACSGRASGASASGGRRGLSGRKCVKGYDACVRYKSRTGAPQAKARRICKQVCAR